MFKLDYWVCLVFYFIFLGLLMKVAKGDDEDYEFSRFDNECDEF